MRTLFLRLERLARSEKVRRNRFRTNLVPDAPRDKHGFLVDGIPSMAIRSGPVFRICKEMRPDFPFNVVVLNKFENHMQCQWHKDRRNVGDSLFAMMGDFEGGALELEDGRRFSEKYQWYRYNGAVTAHGVAPFSGERITCVLYTEPPRTEDYELRSDGFRSLNTEAHEAAAEHPRVKIQEDPAAEAERERVLNIQKEKAALEWRQTAANKLWLSLIHI